MRDSGGVRLEQLAPPDRSLTPREREGLIWLFTCIELM